MTNVPQITFGPTGPQAPTEAQILAGVQADILAAFGGNLNMAQTTPQGQLSVSMAAIIGNVYGQFIGLSNMFDPAFAQGRYQDALARIYFLRRNPALPTTFSAVCSGLPNVVIPAGTQIQDTAQNTYISTAPGTIGPSGNVTIPFANSVAGPIAVPNSVTPFQAISGWDSVAIIGGTGLLGQNVETRSAFETRRQNSVAANSVGSVASIRGAVLNVPGVADCYVTENQSTGTATIGGVNIPANSLYVAAVYTGSATGQAVAQAIWSRKIPGCAYYPGNTTFTVLDQNSGYSPPFPSYQVTFVQPQTIPVFIAIQIVQSPLVPANATTLIQNAVLNAFVGGDGGPKYGIGSLMVAQRFTAPIYALGLWAQVRINTIATPNQASAVFTGQLVNGSLTVTNLTGNPGIITTFAALSTGSAVSGTTTAVFAGTLITGQVSGSVGGTGVYTTNQTQTLAAQTMNATPVNNATSPININQTPQLVAANIFVSFA